MTYYYKSLYHQSLQFFQRCFEKPDLKNIRGESTLSKTCSYRTPTSVKRDFTQVFPERLQTAQHVKNRLHYRVAVPKNFTNWQENTRDRVLYIIVAGKKASIFTKKKLHQPCFLVNLMKFSWKIFWESTSQGTNFLIANTG